MVVDDVFLLAARGVLVAGRVEAVERAGFVCGRAATLVCVDGSRHVVEVGPVELFASLVSGPSPEPRPFAFVVRGVIDVAEVPIGSEIVVDEQGAD